MSGSESAAMLQQVAGIARFVQKWLKTLRVANVILLWSFGMAGACDSQSQERAEARELLAKLNAISAEHSLSERSASLAALGKLRLKSPSLIAMRDACRSAHLGLLEAETAQASARKALSEASENRPGSQLSATQAEAISAEIERSNRALADAKTRFPTCERAMRELTTRAH